MELKYALTNKGNPVYTDGEKFCGTTRLFSIEDVYPVFEAMLPYNEFEKKERGIDKITDWKPLPSEKDLEEK